MGSQKCGAGGDLRRGSAYARLGWIFTLAYLFFLVYPIRDLLRSDPSPLDLSLTLAATAAFVAGYLWLMLFRVFGVCAQDPGTYRAEASLILALSGGALTLTLIHGGAWLGFFMYVSIAAGTRLKTKTAVRAILGLTVLTAAVALVLGGSWLDVSQMTILTAAVGMSMVGWVRMTATVRELHAAREELARLAVAEERLRFARDLHDLLGHSLSLITLKSELAGRLLPDAPKRAATEVRDVERVAREALSEVREAVSGYRRPTLVSELDGAREMLSAADVECRTENAAKNLPQDVDAVLAWAVREGVTNVIRHGRARRCEVRVGRDDSSAWAEVVDDGRGPGEEPGGSPAGSGLSGLAERVSAGGGSLEAGPRPAGGFGLRVTLPLGGARAAVSKARAGAGGKP